MIFERIINNYLQNVYLLLFLEVKGFSNFLNLDRGDKLKEHD